MRQANLSSFASPFMFPRVSGAEITNACAHTAQLLGQDTEVAKLVYIHPTTIAVTFIGGGAFTSYSRHTATRGLSVSRARINLPYVDPLLHLSRKTANQWVGYTVHELLHIIFTNDRSWARVADPELLRERRDIKGTWFKGKLLNGIEDARIEACGARIGFAPGAQYCIHALVREMIEKSKDMPSEAVLSIRNFPWILAVGLRGYGVGEKEIIDALPKDLAAVYKFAAKKYAEAKKNPDFFTPDNGTTLMVRIATSVYRKLQKLAEEKRREEPEEQEEWQHPTPNDGEDGEDGGESGKEEEQQRGSEDDGDAEAEGEGDGEGEDEGEGEGEGDAGSDGNDGEEDGEGKTGGSGYSQHDQYENPDHITSEAGDLTVEPSPSMDTGDSALAMGRDYAVFVLKKKR